MKRKNLIIISYITITGVFMLLWANCSSSKIYRNYYTIRLGAEDDVNILKICLRSEHYQIKDTIYFLSPLIDPIEEEKYSNGADLPKLFARYPSHPIPLLELRYDSTSLFFRSDWFAIDSAGKAIKAMFEFRGIPSADSINGTLILYWYVARINSTATDTVYISFISSR